MRNKRKIFDKIKKPTNKVDSKNFLSFTSMTNYATLAPERLIWREKFQIMLSSTGNILISVDFFSEK